MSNQQLLQLFQQSWAKNKYWVMGRSQQAYNQIRLLAKHNQWTEEKQRTYEAILASLATVPPTKKTTRVVAEHIWGYFKKEATIQEKVEFQRLLADEDIITKMPSFLKQLQKKYPHAYLAQMRWFDE